MHVQVLGVESPQLRFSAAELRKLDEVRNLAMTYQKLVGGEVAAVAVNALDAFRKVVTPDDTSGPDEESA